MDWPAWVEQVFARVVERWKGNERAQRMGVPLSVEALAPDLASLYPHDDLLDALIEAYVDLDWLGVVADAENEGIIQATPHGQRAMAEGLMPVVLPHLRVKCRALHPDQRRFLAALVEATRLNRDIAMPPRWLWFPVEHIYQLAFPRLAATEEIEFRASDTAWELWGEGLAVRDGRAPIGEGGSPQMFVAALSGGFACARMHISSADAENATRPTSTADASDQHATTTQFMSDMDTPTPSGGPAQVWSPRRDRREPEPLDDAKVRIAEAEIAAAWREAAEALGIDVETKGTVVDSDGHVVPYALIVRQFGSANGTVCCYYRAPKEERRRLRAWAQELGLYWSALGDGYRRYDRDLFIATLDDWRWFGDEAPPGWYSGGRWGD